MNWPWAGPQPFPPYQQPFHPMPPFPGAPPMQRAQPPPMQQPQAPPQPQQQLRPPPPPPHFFASASFPVFAPPFHPPHQNAGPVPVHHRLQHFIHLNPHSTQHVHQQHPKPNPPHPHRPNQPQRQKLNQAQTEHLTQPPRQSNPAKRQKPVPQERSSRDLAMAHETARRLGTNLPGDTEDEIRRWVEARKRNWPSRANVARKLEAARGARGGKEKDTPAGGNAGKEDIGALAMLAEYASSDDDAVEGKEKGKVDGGAKNASGKDEKGKDDGRKGRRGRRKRGRARRRGRGVDKSREKVPVRKMQPLLRMLLKDEIERESTVLLQAFRFLVRQRKLELQKGERSEAKR